jgi:hypothetical protein
MELYLLLVPVIIVEVVIILYFGPSRNEKQITAITPKPEPQSAVIDQSRQLEKEEFARARDVERIDRIISLAEEEEKNLPKKRSSRQI